MNFNFGIDYYSLISTPFVNLKLTIFVIIVFSRTVTDFSNCQSQHIRIHNADHTDHSDQQQSNPADGSLPELYLRSVRRGGDGGHQKQQRAGGTSGSVPEKHRTGSQKDQSRESVWSSVSRAVSDPGVWSRPITCQHHCQRRENLQVQVHCLFVSFYKILSSFICIDVIRNMVLF